MNFSTAAAVLCLVALSATVTTGLELDADNIDDMTAGKTVFIKFFAPWCGHCKSMASDWEKLMNDYKDHAVALVAEVDCTDTINDEICEEFDVQGFPTLKYGSREAPEDYDGGRDYDSMAAFAKEHITKASCSLAQLDACSDEEKAQIEVITAYDDAKLQETVAAIKVAVTAEEKKFNDDVTNLQDLYETMTNEHNAVMEAIKTEHKFKYVSQVMKQRGLKLPTMDTDDTADDDDDDDDDDKMGDTAGEL